MINPLPNNFQVPLSFPCPKKLCGGGQKRSVQITFPHFTRKNVKNNAPLEDQDVVSWKIHPRYHNELKVKVCTNYKWKIDTQQQQIDFRKKVINQCINGFGKFPNNLQGVGVKNYLGGGLLSIPCSEKAKWWCPMSTHKLKKKPASEVGKKIINGGGQWRNVQVGSTSMTISDFASQHPILFFLAQGNYGQS